MGRLVLIISWRRKDARPIKIGSCDVERKKMCEFIKGYYSHQRGCEDGVHCIQESRSITG